MTYETETRLKSYLDTNQLGRERLCLAVLAADKRFTDIRPRHPHGGRDGGVDIDALFSSSQRAAGAIGFLVGANDSAEQKRTIDKKFKTDAKSALNHHSKPAIFVFFTNVDLTLGEKGTLKEYAKKLGFADCDIFDRERIRVILDSVDGFAARFQYLGIPLSEAEQASFFFEMGDDIQSVIATGFQRVEQTLGRLTFLQESYDVLSGIYIQYVLDRVYTGDEVGPFRCFCNMALAEPKHEIYQMVFGSADMSDRFRDQLESPRPPAGIKYGYGSGQWEHHVSFSNNTNEDRVRDASPANDEDEKWIRTGSSYGGGSDEVQFLSAGYQHDAGFFRFQPRMLLRDLQGAWFIHYLNASLARKVKAIHVIANGYELAAYERDQFWIDESPFDPKLEVEFTSEELKDPWVRIRPQRSSSHIIDFSEFTPRRLFASKEVPAILSEPS